MSDIQKSEKFYGRRKGRPLRDRHQKLIETLLPELSADLSAEQVDMEALFGKKPEEVWLEVGFGAGEHLAWQAGRHPEVGFIGCEPFINGVARMLAYVEDEGLENVRLHADDARLLMDKLPDASLDRMFVLFPDPWHKKRHNFRRMIGPDNMPRFGRLLKDGGDLIVASDHADYVRWILYYVTTHGDFEWLDEGPGDWYERPEGRPKTRYETKALAGIPHYLHFRRKARG